MINAIEARKITDSTTSIEHELYRISTLIKNEAVLGKSKLKVNVINGHLAAIQSTLIKNGYNIICDDLPPYFTHSYISIRW